MVLSAAIRQNVTKKAGLAKAHKLCFFYLYELGFEAQPPPFMPTIFGEPFKAERRYF
jgi:hypothetical protein